MWLLHAVVFILLVICERGKKQAGTVGTQAAAEILNQLRRLAASSSL